MSIKAAITNNYITNTKAPNLPIPTVGYSQTYFEVHDNVLRLYFNQLDQANNLIIQEDNKLNALVWLNAGTGIF